MKQLLIIEDNNDMNEMLTRFLKDDYQVSSAFSGTEGLLLFQQGNYDLILLDRMLPGKTGEEVLAVVRKTSSVPVIMLTAMNEKADIAKLLLAGANDYVTKPFDMDELLARIAVQLRQGQSEPAPVDELAFKNIVLYPDSFEIGCAEARLLLKRKEFEILHLLIKNAKRVYTKEALYQEVWQEPYYGDENTINVHISNIRKKLKQLDDQEEYIETIWGIGVKLASS